MTFPSSKKSHCKGGVNCSRCPEVIPVESNQQDVLAWSLSYVRIIKPTSKGLMSRALQPAEKHSVPHSNGFYVCNLVLCGHCLEILITFILNYVSSYGTME